MFRLTPGEMYNSTERQMHIYYGRTHALNDKWVMDWNGEDCHCWHNDLDALRFLDGLSPQEAVDQLRVHGQQPHIAEQFRRSALGKKLDRDYHAEWMARMQATIWEHYGQRLFELFDVRHPELWKQYGRFIAEFHKISGSKAIPGFPSDNKIC